MSAPHQAPVSQWRALSTGVSTCRHERAQVNVGLVIGTRLALVVDTGASTRAGEELLAAVRSRTELPLVVVNTHPHADHCFGNSAFAPAQIWAHRGCVAALAGYGEVQRAAMLSFLPSGREQERADLVDTELVVPGRCFDTDQDLDLGGRVVHLRHLGRGHTDSDLVVLVPDAGVLFAGDLVEEGPSPGFSDSFPLDWPATLDRLVELTGTARTVVPGHGAPLTPEQVRVQAELVAEVAAAARRGYAAGMAPEQLAGALRLPGWAAGDAAQRAYRQLSGAPHYDPPEAILARIHSS